MDVQYILSSSPAHNSKHFIVSTLYYIFTLVSMMSGLSSCENNYKKNGYFVCWQESVVHSCMLQYMWCWRKFLSCCQVISRNPVKLYHGWNQSSSFVHKSEPGGAALWRCWRQVSSILPSCSCVPFCTLVTDIWCWCCNERHVSRLLQTL